MRAIIRSFAVALALAMTSSAACAELTVNPAVPLSTGRILQPAITPQNAIYRLYPALYASGSDRITADELSRLIHQFDVACGAGDDSVIGWYEPNAHALHPYTYCNYFAADVAQARGAFLPGGLGCCSVCQMPLDDEFRAFYAHPTLKGTVYQVLPAQNRVYQALNARGLICHGECAGSETVYIHLTQNPAASLLVWLNERGASYGWRRVEGENGLSAEMAAQAAADGGALTVGLRADSAAGHIFVVHPNTGNHREGTLYMTEAGANLRADVPCPYNGYTFFTYTTE